MNKPSVSIVLLSAVFILGGARGVLGDRTLLATPPVAADEAEAAEDDDWGGLKEGNQNK